MRNRSIVGIVLLTAVIAALPRAVAAQSKVGATLDEAISPGANYDKAEFRLWLPPDSGRVQAIVILVPAPSEP